MQLERNNTMKLVHEMAASCVTLTEEKYRFYDVSWQRQQRSDPVSICIHTRNNVLHEGDRIYKTYFSANNSREKGIWTNLFRALRENSWQSIGNSSRYTIILRLTNADVQSTLSYSADGRNFTRAVVLSHVENNTLRCAGTVFGRHAAGIMSSRLYGCFGNFSSGVHYIETDATSIVEADAESVVSSSWSTWVAIRFTVRLTDITRGVVDNGDLEATHALTMLLSTGTGKDIDMINKYAVVYKHCSDFLVPQHTDISRTQTFGRADSVRKITVIVSTWGLVLLILWPTLLSSVSLALHMWGRREKFPMNIHGEGDIGRRWLSRCSEKSPSTSTLETIGKKKRSGFFFTNGCLLDPRRFS